MYVEFKEITVTQYHTKKRRRRRRRAIASDPVFLPCQKRTADSTRSLSLSPSFITVCLSLFCDEERRKKKKKRKAHRLFVLLLLLLLSLSPSPSLLLFLSLSISRSSLSIVFPSSFFVQQKAKTKPKWQTVVSSRLGCHWVPFTLRPRPMSSSMRIASSFVALLAAVAFASAAPLDVEKPNGVHLHLSGQAVLALW
jgi:hypothetical protein